MPNRHSDPYSASLFIQTIRGGGYQVTNLTPLPHHLLLVLVYVRSDCREQLLYIYKLCLNGHLTLRSYDKNVVNEV